MRELAVSRPVFILLTAFFCAALSIIYLPILVMIIFSFNSGRYQTLPFREPTFEWYVNLVADSSFVDSFFTSLFMASLASIAATALGFWLLMPLAKLKFHFIHFFLV